MKKQLFRKKLVFTGKNFFSEENYFCFKKKKIFFIQRFVFKVLMQISFRKQSIEREKAEHLHEKKLSFKSKQTEHVHVHTMERFCWYRFVYAFSAMNIASILLVLSHSIHLTILWRNHAFQSIHMEYVYHLCFILFTSSFRSLSIAALFKITGLSHSTKFAWKHIINMPAAYTYKTNSFSFASDVCNRVFVCVHFGTMR